MRRILWTLSSRFGWQRGTVTAPVFEKSTDRVVIRTKLGPSRPQFPVDGEVEATVVLAPTPTNDRSRLRARSRTDRVGRCGR